MKKFLSFSRIPIIVIIVAVSACTTPLQKELLKYTNEDWPEAAKLEKKAMDSYHSVIGKNYTDDITMYDALTNEVLPNYKAFIEKLEDISKNLKEEKLINLHKEYIKIARQQYSGFETAVEALEKQDENKVQEANDILSKAKSDMDKWQKDYEKLCAENNITLE